MKPQTYPQAQSNAGEAAQPERVQVMDRRTGGILMGQLLAAQAAGLPLPGTSDAARLLPMFAKPTLDHRAPEVRAEQRQMADAMKAWRKRQRDDKQAMRRMQTAIAALATIPPAHIFGADAPEPKPARLDLALVSTAIRRWKAKTVANTHIHVRAFTHIRNPEEK